MKINKREEIISSLNINYIDMIVEIKQIAIDNSNQNKYKSSYGEYTMEPTASRSFQVTRGIDGNFRTGLTEEQETRLGRILNKDLSNNSTFWETYRFRFEMPSGVQQLNTTKPFDEIMLAAAKANRLLAESKEELLDDVLLKRRTIFYIHNKEEQDKRKVSLAELKDEIGSLLFASKKNRDRLFWITQKIGEYSTLQYSEESLYKIITVYREKLQTKDKLEDFREILKLTNVELQASYYVKKAIESGVIIIDKEVNEFKFLDKHVGKTREKVIAFFSDKKNESILNMLVNEING